MNQQLVNKSFNIFNQLPPQIIKNNHTQSFTHALCKTTEKNIKELTKSILSEVNPEDKDTLLTLEIEKSLEQETKEILAWTRDDCKNLEMFLQDESKPREFTRKC